jgi:anti-sigma regulatory factor (Ser/Thr protein kinase)
MCRLPDARKARRGVTSNEPVLIYERILPALPPCVGRIRRELDDALVASGVPADRRADVALVVTEAATNVVLHAYLDAAPGPLYVTGNVARRTLRVTVADCGRGLLERDDSPGAGFGTALMQALSDLLEYDARATPGTCLVATFGEAAAAKRVPAARRRTEAAALADYARSLAEASAALHDDTSALIAEARQAVAQARAGQRRRQALVASA